MHSNLWERECEGNHRGFNIVDSAGDVGEFCSLALDNNDYPHISYFDDTNNDLKYASWTGSSWVIESVDTAGSVGDYTSIALDDNGNPHISYRDYTNYDLKYASWTGTGWNIETVDVTGSVGSWTSLALDANSNPHISYRDYTNYDLKYASWTGTGWNIETVDAGGIVGRYSSLALDDNGNPHISYRDSTNGDLKYASWTGTGWNTETVDATGDVGYHTSLALDSSGNPHISYYDETNDNLKYVSWTGTGWNIQSVDVNGDVGEYTSLALDANGNPHISYRDYTYGDLKYASWTGTGWSIETVDSAGNVGSFSSLALDSKSRPHISYYDGSSYDLKTAEALVVPPSAPVNLVATPGDEQVDLTWSPPLDYGGVAITNYKVYRGTTSGGESFLAIVGNVTSYLDAGLTNGQTYFYQVSAVNSEGEGLRSNEASTTPAGGPFEPTAPQNLAATPGDSEVDLTWSAPSSDGGSPITNYNIYRGTSPGSETLLETIGNQLTYTDTDVANGQTYFYKVSAVNGVGEGPQSNEASATPGLDSEAPIVESTTPGDGTTDVEAGTNIVVTFSEAMDESATESAFSLRTDSTEVAGTVSWSDNGRTLTFDPAEDLEEGKTYQITITSEAQDPAGNSLATASQTSFATEKAEGPSFIEQYWWVILFLIIIIIIIALISAKMRRRPLVEDEVPTEETASKRSEEVSRNR